MINLIFVILAAIAAIAGLGLLWWRSRLGRELALIVATKTSVARDVASMAPGGVVALKGKLSADTLLKGEFSGHDCIYYRALVEREVERDLSDSDGISSTARVFETVWSTEEHAPCRLEDASGAVAINFAGAKVEAIQSHLHYEAGGALSVVGAVLKVKGGRVLGHRYTEWIFPPAVPVYILGTVLAGGAVGASPRRANRFIISHKSEKEQIWSLTATRLRVTAGAVVCFVLAVGLLACGGAAG